MENDIVKRIEKIVKRAGDDVAMEKGNFSYIKQLFPHLGSDAEVVLIYHVPRHSAKVDKDESVDVKDKSVAEESAFDITGSPLEHSFGDDSFHQTLTPIRRNWLKSEEKHRPIPKRYAAEFLNVIQEELESNGLWTIPIFALCSSTEDEGNTVLLGTHHEDVWWTPIDASIDGYETLSFVQSDFGNLMSQHLKETHTRGVDNLKVCITCTYELCGASHEMIDWKQEKKSEFKGYLKIETSWNTLTLVPPPRTNSSHLFAEIVTGSSESPLNDLWQQILLLNNYMAMYEDYHKRECSSQYSVAPLIFPQDFVTPYRESNDRIMCKLNRLLSGDDNFDDHEDTEVLPQDNTNEYEKLIDIVKELPGRLNRDFTDKLWQIIRGTDNYVQMIDSIHAVFEAIVEKDYKPQLNDNDDTRLGKMIGKLDSQHPKAFLQAGSLSLELVIDAGMEKIERDYIYLLSTMNLKENYELKQILVNNAGDDFNITKYREKLMALIQIHVSLEFLHLIQSHLTCRCDISRSIFETTLKVYQGAKTPVVFQDLTQPTIYTLAIPTPKEFVTEVSKMNFTSCMCELHTTKKDQQWKTITHYSKIPIFPPNIYKIPRPESVPDDTEELYHITKASVLYFKFC